MKRTVILVIPLFLFSCYKSINQDGSDLRTDDTQPDPYSELYDPMYDPMVDPLPDPWTDPLPDPITDPGYDPHPDPYVDPIIDPYVDPPPDPVYNDDMPICPPGLTYCYGECVDVNSDPRHCGWCGNACPPGWSCVLGRCIATDPCEGIVCPGGLTCCFGECVDTRRDPENCGDCGVVCPWGSSDPALNYEGCLNPDLGVYNLCCGGFCRPVSNRHCGECRSSCGPGYSCTGLWDGATGDCRFMCMGFMRGATGDGCGGPNDCMLVPTDERQCLTELFSYLFPGGYCSASCSTSMECGPGASCVDIIMDSLCFRDCFGDSDCRIDEGYTCMEMPFIGGGPYCLPM